MIAHAEFSKAKAYLFRMVHVCSERRGKLPWLFLGGVLFLSFCLFLPVQSSISFFQKWIDVLCLPCTAMACVHGTWLVL